MMKLPSRRWALGLLPAALALASFIVVAPTTPAAAAATPTYQVTMVARWCSSYTDIFGNRARNDIMESLRDLGPNTPYSPFVQVDPAVEDGRAPQSTCHPLPNWTFSFGTGIGRPAPGTNLSYVTGTSSVANRQVTTEAATPLLDGLGVPTGDSIAGAKTFTLTSTEAGLASQNNKLWVMGGTPSDPLDGQTGTYGFGALRCAKDNLNGDNVEWIGYPSGAKHVFCYAFYVKPPPEAGVINIVKKLNNGLTLPAAQTFGFDGNLSFNPGGDFSLDISADTNSASKEFVRGAGGTPWTVNELVPDGFVLTSLQCTDTNQLSTWQVTGASVDIALGAGDTVTCTFTNDLAPPPAGQGELFKQVLGEPYGVPADAMPSTWAFDVTDPASSTAVVQLPVDPTTGVADSGPISDLTAGQWTVAERIPAPTAAGEWRFVAALCVDSQGQQVTTVEAPAAPSISVNVPDGGRAACMFINLFVPTSKLTIRLTTLGGVGTFGFQVQGAGDENIGGTNDGVLLQQRAITTAAGTKTTATGDSTDPLYGNWYVTPIAPSATASGRWAIDSLPTCSTAGGFSNVGDEQLSVHPGASAPDLICDYVYRWVPASTLDVVKRIEGDPAGQTNTVVLAISCNDGTSARLDVPNGSTSPQRLPAALTFVYPTLCTVQETDDGGGGAPVGVSSAITVNGHASSRSADSFPVGSEAGSEDLVVTFTNSYSSVSPATSAPGTTDPTLPATGGGGSSPTLIEWALGMLGLGALLLALRRHIQPNAH
jgi:MYXO-CTERM domain-containing protein